MSRFCPTLSRFCPKVSHFVPFCPEYNKKSLREKTHFVAQFLLRFRNLQIGSVLLRFVANFIYILLHILRRFVEAAPHPFVEQPKQSIGVKPSSVTFKRILAIIQQFSRFHIRNKGTTL